MSEQQPGMNRREFLRKVGIGAGATLAAGAVGVGGYELARKHRYDDSRHRTQPFFERGIGYDWRKFGVFDGVIQIDPSAKLSSSIFGDSKKQETPPSDGILVAVRPIGVRLTLLRVIDDYDQDVQNRVKRVLPEISDNLVAFWKPDSTELAYLDVREESGFVLALGGSTVGASGVVIDRIDMHGHEVRGNMTYPYRNNFRTEYKPSEYVQAELDRLEADPTKQDEYHEKVNEAHTDHFNYKAVNHVSVYGHSLVAENQIYATSIAWRPDEYMTIPAL